MVRPSRQWLGSIFLQFAQLLGPGPGFVFGGATSAKVEINCISGCRATIGANADSASQSEAAQI